uniref:Sulfatase N-terminal domain-containing protein n=1 Tax=Coccolithus braarudii TaxID=221442 RepID=A0A7S0L239_9EUKA
MHASAPHLRSDEKLPPLPHVAIFVADDLGFGEVSWNSRGRDDVRTPNLEALRGRGVTLRRFYTFPSCTPARAAMLTGRLPVRYHVPVRPISRGGVPLDEKMISSVLHDRGYRTAMFGKWHLGINARAFWPSSRGFGLSYGSSTGAIDHMRHTAKDLRFINGCARDWHRNGHALEQAGHATSLIADEATQFIRDHNLRVYDVEKQLSARLAEGGDISKTAHAFRPQPLFIYVAFTALHHPYQISNQSRLRLIRAQTKSASERRVCQLKRAMGEEMDAAIGRIVSALDKASRDNNALVVFLSDNGAPPGCMPSGECGKSFVARSVDACDA